MHGEILKLYEKRPNSIKPGLERIRPAWDKLEMSEYPQKNILIAGTNGKGSTAGMLWKLLATQGYKVGLYSSPHISSFTERFQCSHCPTTEMQIVEQISKLKESVGYEIYQDLSFFEVATLIAINFFKDTACDINILEVGLGGRLDACNIVNPELCAVTSIDRDHVEWLGDELTGIAREKLGIFRIDAPLFWGERFTEEKYLEPVISEFERRPGATILRRHRDFGYDDRTGKNWVKSTEPEHQEFEIPSWVKDSSPILKENYGLAFALFYAFNNKHLGRQANPSVYQKFVDLSFGDTIAWPNTLLGRFQKLKIRDPSTHIHKTAYLDVCHNPASAQEFVTSIRNIESISKQGKIPGLVTILKDKDIDQVLSILRLVLEPIYLFKVDDERSLTKLSLPNNHQDLLIYSCFKQALEAFFEEAPEGPDTFAVCGSFLAVQAALSELSPASP